MFLLYLPFIFRVLLAYAICVQQTFYSSIVTWLFLSRHRIMTAYSYRIYTDGWWALPLFFAFFMSFFFRICYLSSKSRVGFWCCSLRAGLGLDKILLEFWLVFLGSEICTENERYNFFLQFFSSLKIYPY